MNKYRIENPDNKEVQEYKSRTTEKMKKIKVLKIFLFTSLILLMYINSEEIYGQEKELIGKYKYIPNSNFPSDTIILEIKENGKFVYSPYFNNSLDYIMLCKKTEGTWVIKDECLILNSNLQSENPNDLIKIFSFDKADSIKLKFINLSDSTPAMISFPLFNKGEFLTEYMSDSLGVVVIPSKGYDDVSFCLDHICKNTFNLKPIKGGYFYQITYFDCFPEIFENERLKIKGNKLIRKIVINDSVRKYKKIKYKEVYIKQ